MQYHQNRVHKCVHNANMHRYILLWDKVLRSILHIQVQLNNQAIQNC